MILTLLFLLILTLLLPSLARAQSSGSLQVAARVLPAEPSRTALNLALEALQNPAAAPRQSHLAQVSLAPADPADLPSARRVRVDFLRN